MNREPEPDARRTLAVLIILVVLTLLVAAVISAPFSTSASLALIAIDVLLCGIALASVIE